MLRFGSILIAVTVAGVPLSNKEVQWNENELETELQNVVSKLVRLPRDVNEAKDEINDKFQNAFSQLPADACNSTIDKLQRLQITTMADQNSCVAKLWNTFLQAVTVPLAGTSFAAFISLESVIRYFTCVIPSVRREPTFSECLSNANYNFKYTADVNYNIGGALILNVFMTANQTLEGIRYCFRGSTVDSNISSIVQNAPVCD